MKKLSLWLTDAEFTKKKICKTFKPLGRYSLAGSIKAINLVEKDLKEDGLNQFELETAPQEIRNKCRIFGKRVVESVTKNTIDIRFYKNIDGTKLAVITTKFYD